MEGADLLARLDDEWAHLRTSRRALRTARSWADVDTMHPLATVVVELGDLDDLRLATQQRDDPAHTHNSILLALVELARGDELAGRIVLQRLLPALILQAARYRSFTDRTDPLGQVIAAAWLAIRSYDVERRREHVASSLISDAVFQAFRRQLRQQARTEEVRAPHEFVPTPWFDEPTTSLDEFVTMLREARQAGVPADDLDLLRQLVRVGSPGIVARQRNVTPRTIRNRRDRAIDHVRAALAVGVAA
jgi:hypothetical protein